MFVRATKFKLGQVHFSLKQATLQYKRVSSIITGFPDLEEFYILLIVMLQSKQVNLLTTVPTMGE